MVRLRIDPSIERSADLDLESLWDRFEVFEALHHQLRICNPMTDMQLDEVIEAAELSTGQVVVDFGCGYGELLLRAAGQASIMGTGVDLSPWMITEAQRRSTQRAPTAHLHWVIGPARDHQPAIAPDVAVCVGAEWLWHDFGGTARALSSHLVSGGIAVIAGPRRHFGATDADLAGRGRIDTVDDMRHMLELHRLEPFHRIDPDDTAWDRYLDATASGAAAWAVAHPGRRAERWIDEQRDWQAARDRDRRIIGWSLWLARKR